MSYLQNEINIIISGWASSGTTSTALILSYILGKKFIYAGGTHKYIAEQLGYNPKGKDFMEYEEKYGEKWDLLWEKYIKWKLENEKNLLVNSKIAGFLSEKVPHLFEVFITAELEIRRQRAGTDKRTEDIERRDEELNFRWDKLFDVKMMDLAQIRATHDYVISNDNISIAQTAFKIYSVMKNAMGLTKMLLLSDFEKLEQILSVKGKDFFYTKLAEKGLLISTEEIFSDWREHFEDELNQTAEEWRNVVYGKTA